MMHQSIATIDSPEFINLQPLEINPLMSSCEIKVLYLGENRNHSYITKDVAKEMAKTLRGAPIVGYYKEEKEDFADHGERVIFDDEGVKFECMTKPYGFVSPNAEVWFQKFEDTDEFGNVTTREYLMTTGYLWTEQFEECKSVIENGKNQSMELDEKNLDGHWATNDKTGMDFFIINDAIFSKLCILGDDVEPCFEGARITAPEVSTSFTKIDDNFKKTLFTMMQDLKFALEEGGKNMDIETTNTTIEEAVENAEETIVAENEESMEETQSEEDNNVETPIEEETESEEDAAAAPEEEKAEEETSIEEEAEENKDYAALESEYTQLQADYQDLESKYQALVEFKNQIEEEKKDALINSFYMLSEEDKKDVIANKSNYSLDDIEAKLSIICVRKKVNFDLEDTTKNEENIEANKEDIVTYNMSNVNDASIPAWINAVKEIRDSRK